MKHQKKIATGAMVVIVSLLCFGFSTVEKSKMFLVAFNGMPISVSGTCYTFQPCTGANFEFEDPSGFLGPYGLTGPWPYNAYTFSGRPSACGGRIIHDVDPNPAPPCE